MSYARFQFLTVAAIPLACPNGLYDIAVSETHKIKKLLDAIKSDFGPQSAKEKNMSGHDGLDGNLGNATLVSFRHFIQGNLMHLANPDENAITLTSAFSFFAHTILEQKSELAKVTEDESLKDEKVYEAIHRSQSDLKNFVSYAQSNISSVDHERREFVSECLYNISESLFNFEIAYGRLEAFARTAKTVIENSGGEIARLSRGCEEWKALHALTKTADNKDQAFAAIPSINAP